VQGWRSLRYGLPCDPASYSSSRRGELTLLLSILFGYSLLKISWPIQPKGVKLGGPKGLWAVKTFAMVDKSPFVCTG